MSKLIPTLFRMFGYNGTNWKAVGLDSITRHLPVIQQDHHETHEGDHYFIKTFIDVTVATPLYFMFRTPNTSTRIHARAAISGEGEFEVEIYEDATINADGVSLPTLNNDRDSINTSELVAFSAPTVGADGTLIWSTKIGSGKDATVSPGLNYEIIAKTDSDYLFKVTKIGATTLWLTLDFWWYEHVDAEA